MVQRHLSIPHRFICFTDNPKDIDTNIEIRLLPEDKNYQGWWWKPYIFKQGHFNNGDVNLFIDLDMVIVKNIDQLITYMPDKFIGLRDVSRVFGTVPTKLGSAVLRWPANEYSDIWSTLELNYSFTKKFPGDQDLIWYLHRNSITFYPDNWIVSYKWEVRSRSELTLSNSVWNFKEVRNPDINPNTCILAFHGTPNPHDVKDPIILDNWR
jgi:hypothetical protein